ncbi:RING-H2 finger protein ATL39-like [Cucumis melo var. makuwa]|uniref:RING-type E3 ubiquitin transferase n=2 Tax=Cucumis melo TaxID=3656 RepID=A0A5D3BEF0_CUCMM|nr:RING-H2 finger protein ATL39-like [Cucumis melo var. makuwa]
MNSPTAVSPTTMPSPPPPPDDLPVGFLSALDLDFLNVAGLSALAMMFIYFIFTCYERKFWNRNGDIEGGQLPSVTMDESPASETGDSSRRRPSSRAVISTRLFQYGVGGGVIGKNADCSICLDEFTEGEICRMLPKCKHVFHRFCIDQWLPNERNCPVCRSPVYVRLVYSFPS